MNIKKYVDKFARNAHAETNHRYLSYEHCFKYFNHLFGKASITESERDLMALNLGMYLASWGMYRGSSQLLQKDYKIHLEIVDIILDKEYSTLYKITPNEYTIDNLYQIEMLYSQIGEKYTDLGVSPTDTLVTKVILGTLGCTIAYDQFAKNGFGKLGITKKFGEKNLKEIKRFYTEKQVEFQECYNKLIKYEQHDFSYYPMMKMIDMCLFEFGKE